MFFVSKITKLFLSIIYILKCCIILQLNLEHRRGVVLESGREPHGEGAWSTNSEKERWFGEGAGQRMVRYLVGDDVTSSSGERGARICEGSTN